MNDYQRFFLIRTHIRYYERQIEFFRTLLTIERLVVLLGAGSAVFALKSIIPNEVGYIGSLAAGTLAIVLAGLRIDSRTEIAVEYLGRWRHAKARAEKYMMHETAFGDDVLDAIADAEEDSGSPLRYLLLLAENDILAADDQDKRIVVPALSKMLAPLFDFGDCSTVKVITVPRIWADHDSQGSVVSG